MVRGRDLIERGYPTGKIVGLALEAAERASANDSSPLEDLVAVRDAPEAFLDDPRYAEVAREWLRLRGAERTEGEGDDALRDEPLPFQVFGEEMIEEGARRQMRDAMRLPVSVGGALMPDSHQGYGLPIGGVLATEGVVIPYAVGVDIAPLRGDTLIPTLDGRSYPIRELCESEEQFGVWSCEPDGRVVAAKARAFRTQRDAPLVRVTLDNGRAVECTPDHRFMQRDGVYVEAGQLAPGTSLMPFHCRRDKEGYMRVQQNHSGTLRPAHWIVARSGLLGRIPRFEGQRTVIHRKNFDEADNRPENLQFMGGKDHSRHHLSLAERNIHWRSEEFERKRIAALSAKRLTPEGMAEYCMRAENLKAYWAERPEEFQELLERVSKNNRTPERRAQSAQIGARVYECGICGQQFKSVIALASHHRWKHPDRRWEETYVNIYNHKVATVERLSESEDVYCLEVPEHHNFAVSAGVFVHNCRMRMTVFDVSEHVIGQRRTALAEALLRNTNFGAGGKYKPGRRGAEHEVLDDPTWEASPFLRKLKDTAHAQLGTSGSGNHFVEWGAFEALEDLALPSGGTVRRGERRLALLSHSGSRGVGARIADRYTKIAKSKHPSLEGNAADLAWLSLSSEEGAEYWLSMNLAGRFAAANHAVIHEKLSRALSEVLGGEEKEAVSWENHHNFSWREAVRDRSGGEREVIVHRKGATPAGPGVMGVIPGSMGDAGYVVRGKGNAHSLNSASHGAGRLMSRRRAFETISDEDLKAYLERKGVTLIGGSRDEAPQAYKRIEEVLAAQADLVDLVGSFTPAIVRMDEAAKPRWMKNKKR